MRVKLIIITVTVILGFTSGYFSDPVERFFSDLRLPEFKLREISGFLGSERPGAANLKKVSATISAPIDSVKGSISGEAAVEAVKALPAVKQLASSAASQGCQVIFRADQSPTTEYPVWLVELRQIFPNQIPDITFLKVDSKTGRVLDIQKDELQTAGIKLASPLPPRSGAGRLLQIRSVYSQNLKRKVNLLKYNGLEIESDRNKEVIRMTVTGNVFKGPRGMIVGADFDDVVKKFGKPNIAQADLLIFNALDNKNMQLHIKIKNSKVAAFSMIKIME